MSETSAHEHGPVRAIAAGLRELGRRGIDLLLPAQCLACRTLVGEPGHLCSKCFGDAHLLAEPMCRICGLPLAGAASISGKRELDMACGACIADPPAYARARAVFAFGDVAKRLVHDLKYHDRLAGRKSFGAWMARAGADMLESADLIVPVPLHYFRLVRRRYNQAAVLAGAVAKASGVPAAPMVLKRVRSTVSQTGLSAEARARNVRNAFEVRQGFRARVKNAQIVLVDDVLTTGATVEACTRVLVKSGAREVSVLTLARVGER
jgi:ComF family protein